MRRPILIGLAGVLASFALGLLAYYLIEQPTTLRVAVGPAGSEDARLMVAVAQHLARDRQSTRFKIVTTQGLVESARALESEKADLAIVRPDVALPAKGQTVAIMHRDAVLVIAPERSGIHRIADLRGRRIGLVKAPANQRLLDAILTHYEVPKDSVTSVFLDRPDEAEPALSEGRIDAVLTVGTLGGRTVSETVAALLRAAGERPLVFVPVNEAEAIAQRNPLFESAEIVRGAFGGTPPRPPDPIRTLGVNHRLVASASLDDNVVAEVTRLLFVMRPALASEVPLANRIEGPDTSKSSTLPLHPGAAAYYEGEVQTFFDRYSDWIYLGIMALSIAGSAVAGIASTAAARNRTRTLGLLDRLLAIVRLARAAETEAELHALEHEADEILAATLGQAGSGGIDETGMGAFSLGLDQVRQAIATRRAQLADHAPALVRAAE